MNDQNETSTPHWVDSVDEETANWPEAFRAKAATMSSLADSTISVPSLSPAVAGGSAGGPAVANGEMIDVASSSENLPDLSDERSRFLGRKQGMTAFAPTRPSFNGFEELTGSASPVLARPEPRIVEVPRPEVFSPAGDHFEPLGDSIDAVSPLAQVAPELSVPSFDVGTVTEVAKFSPPTVPTPSVFSVPVSPPAVDVPTLPELGSLADAGLPSFGFQTDAGLPSFAEGVSASRQSALPNWAVPGGISDGLVSAVPTLDVPDFGTVPPVVAAPSNLSTSVPSVEIPTLSIPSVDVPMLSVPSMDIPSVSVPPVSVPPVDIPSVSIPSVSVSVSVPSVSEPSMEFPSVATPTFDIPAGSAPSVHIPTFDMPAVSTPSLDIPSLDIPSFDIPSSDIPSLDIPSLDIPSFDIPSFDIPSFDIPTLDIPTLGVPAMHVPNVEVPALPSWSTSVTAEPAPQPAWPTVEVTAHSAPPSSEPANVDLDDLRAMLSGAPDRFDGITRPADPAEFSDDAAPAPEPRPSEWTTTSPAAESGWPSTDASAVTALPTFDADHLPSQSRREESPVLAADDTEPVQPLGDGPKKGSRFSRVFSRDAATATPTRTPAAEERQTRVMRTLAAGSLGVAALLLGFTLLNKPAKTPTPATVPVTAATVPAAEPTVTPSTLAPASPVTTLATVDTLPIDATAVDSSTVDPTADSTDDFFSSGEDLTVK